jgi:acyl-CoA synthetase (AMP-forming)/AMP-acid ligase II
MGGALILEYLLTGSSVLVSNRFEPDLDVARMRAGDVRTIAAGASYLRMAMLSGRLSKQALPTLEQIVIGAEPSDFNLLRQIWGEWPGVVIHIRYGVSESVGALTRLSLRQGQEYTTGLVGHPLPGVEVRIDNGGDSGAGRVLVRSRAAAMGVLLPSGVDPVCDGDGWLDTNDLGDLDSQGRLRLIGRSSWMIKRGGFRVSPQEIEEALQQHPEVGEALVLGVPSPNGERLVAVLVPRRTRRIEVATLVEHSRRLLSAHKIPQEFVFWDQLPRNANNKVDRFTVLDRLVAATSEGVS